MSRLEALIEPLFFKQVNAQRLVPEDTIMRTQFMRQWFGYSDPAMEKSMHYVLLLLQFTGIDEVQGDSASHQKNRTIEHFESTLGISILSANKKPQVGKYR